MFKAYAAQQAKGPLSLIEYDPEGRFLRTIAMYAEVTDQARAAFKYRDQLSNVTNYVTFLKDWKKIDDHTIEVEVSRGQSINKLFTDLSGVGMEVLSHGQTVFTVTENGYGKRTSIDEYPLRHRGGKGVITIKTSERNGRVVGLLLVGDDDELMLMTNAGKLIRMPVKGVSVISRNTQGVKLIEMEAAETLVGAATLEMDGSNGDEDEDSDPEETQAESGEDADA